MRGLVEDALRPSPKTPPTIVTFSSAPLMGDAPIAMPGRCPIALAAPRSFVAVAAHLCQRISDNPRFAPFSGRFFRSLGV